MSDDYDGGDVEHAMTLKRAQSAVRPPQLRRAREAVLSDSGSGSLSYSSDYSSPRKLTVEKLRATEEIYRKIAGEKFPEFTPDQVNELISQFLAFDTNGSGHVDPSEIATMMRNIGEDVDLMEIDRILKSIDEDGNGTIEFDEFLLLYRKLRTSASSVLGNVYTKLLSQQTSWKHFFRGIDARLSTDMMLRTASQRLTRHSEMADHKANVLITVCAIILSFAINQINAEQGSYSLVTFSAFTTLALFFAVGAVMPRYLRDAKVANSKNTVKNFNILYFEDFSEIPLDTFMNELAETMRNDETLYAVMVKDLYLTGVNLSNNKYRWIRRSYFTFAWGTIATILVFVLSSVFNWKFTHIKDTTSSST